MDLAFSPEQDELVRTARAVRPAGARAPLGPLGPDRRVSHEAWRRMGELGLLGLRVPAALRRPGADFVTVGIAMEEIGRGDFPAPTASSSRASPARSWDAAATRRSRALAAPDREGEAVVALALTEPGAGSDAADWPAGPSARRRVRHHRREVRDQPRHGRACRDRLRAHRSRGPRARRDRLPGAARPAGVSRSPLRDMGTRAIARAVLAFDHVRLPASHRLGEEGTGFYEVMRASTTTASASRSPASGWPSSRSRRPWPT